MCKHNLFKLDTLFLAPFLFLMDYNANKNVRSLVVPKQTMYVNKKLDLLQTIPFQNRLQNCDKELSPFIQGAIKIE